MAWVAWVAPAVRAMPVAMVALVVRVGGCLVLVGTVETEGLVLPVLVG